MSLAIDRILKNKAAGSTETDSLLAINAIADAHQYRHDYLLRVLSVTAADAAKAFPNPNSDGPTISNAFVVPDGRVFIKIGPHRAGLVLRHEYGYDLGAVPNVSGASNVWDNEDIRILAIAAGPSPVFVKARYFVGFSSTPASAQTFTVYRVPLELVLLRVIRDTAASDDTQFSKYLAAVLTVWLSSPFQGTGSNDSVAAEKRTHFINAFTTRSQNTIALLKGLGPINTWSSAHAAVTSKSLSLPLPPIRRHLN